MKKGNNSLLKQHKHKKKLQKRFWSIAKKRFWSILQKNVSNMADIT